MATPRSRMNHMLVVLPGITGSALSKDGMELWGPAPSAIASYIRTLGRSLDWLPLRHEEDPDYDDGIRATRLVPYTLVPGLDRFDGYSGLRAHLHRQFQLIDGDALDPDGAAANYFEFPYDWRKSNAVSAAKLQQLIARELPKWRDHSDSPDAKVILIAHSMGGLVSRHYIEVLKGYPNVRALVTYGTPHRGSPQAISYLVDGYRKGPLELHRFTAMLQSYPSVYQLLPRYPAIQDRDGIWKRVCETAADLPKIDRTRAKNAYDFYIDIESAHAKNRLDPEYGVEMLPMVGWGHETKQSARVIDDLGDVEIGHDLPPAVDAVFANGDGTVPRVSAVPVEFNSEPARWWMLNQKHALMQNNADMLANLSQVLSAMQGDLRQPARAAPGFTQKQAIGLQMAELFERDEPVTLEVTAQGSENPREIVAEIEAIDASSPPRKVTLSPTGNIWSAAVEGLAPGRYRISVHPANPDAGPTIPVADVFEVM